MSDFSFFSQRGCCHGDLISPHIFILCVEVLGVMLRKKKSNKGIKIHNEEF